MPAVPVGEAGLVPSGGTQPKVENRPSPVWDQGLDEGERLGANPARRSGDETDSHRVRCGTGSALPGSITFRLISGSTRARMRLLMLGDGARHTRDRCGPARSEAWDDPNQAGLNRGMYPRSRFAGGLTDSRG
jgi:hypothetical protein